jgi:WD40 repeat protein
MSQATAVVSTNAGLPSNSYIYKVISTAPRQDPLSYSKLDQLAIISSDDSLRFLEPQTLNPTPNGVIRNVSDKVTCLERANDGPSNILATAGRDGFIRFWDKRTCQKALEIESREYSAWQVHEVFKAKESHSAQAHIVIGMRCSEELHCGWH